MTKSAKYSDWAPLFGKSVLEPDVVSALKHAGFDKVPVIARDESETAKDIGESTIAFCIPEFIGRQLNLGDGVGIVHGMVMHLEDDGSGPYEHALPFGITLNDNQASLRQRLGEPAVFDEDDPSDEWQIEGLEVTAMYTEDLSGIETLMVYLTEED